jgi:hypothetical protein
LGNSTPKDPNILKNEKAKANAILQVIEVTDNEIDHIVYPIIWIDKTRIKDWEGN